MEKVRIFQSLALVAAELDWIERHLTDEEGLECFQRSSGQHSSFWTFGTPETREVQPVLEMGVYLSDDAFVHWTGVVSYRDGGARLTLRVTVASNLPEAVWFLEESGTSPRVDPLRGLRNAVSGSLKRTIVSGEHYHLARADTLEIASCMAEAMRSYLR